MDNNDVENTVQSECEDYPSACFLLDSCFQDYQRIQDNYNKIGSITNFVGFRIPLVATTAHIE